MYGRYFLDELQMAAESAGIEFDPATRTELELEQLHELYEAEGLPMAQFVRRHMKEGYHA